MSRQFPKNRQITSISLILLKIFDSEKFMIFLQQKTTLIGWLLFKLLLTNYLPLTTSLNFLPAENTGAVFAGMLIALPV